MEPIEESESDIIGDSDLPLPTAYIKDRTRGKGRSHPIPEGETESDEDRRPPCFACYVPPPVLWCSRILEQNCFCEAFGSIGCFGHESYETRKKILTFGLLANILSLILSLVACFSLSLQFNHITASAFSKGVAYIPELEIPTSRIWIGLRAVAVRNFEGQSLINENYREGDQVVPFGEFCSMVGEGLEYYMDPDECDSCAEASNGLMASVLLATLLIIPNIFTDILRMYPNYDLNCQKFLGSVLNMASAAASLYAYRGYASNCFRAFYPGDDDEDTEYLLSLASNSTAISALISAFREENPDVGALSLSFFWNSGNGLTCIVLATMLKAFDIIAMLLIPTPVIAHRRSLQEEYELLYGSKNEEAILQDSGEESDNI